MVETYLPDACSMFCVEIVKMTRMAKCSVSTGSKQFASWSSSSCLWHRINVLEAKKGNQ